MGIPSKSHYRWLACAYLTADHSLQYNGLEPVQDEMTSSEYSEDALIGIPPSAHI